MGLSENSVPRKNQWLMIIIPTKWLFHWGYTPFSDIPIWMKYGMKHGMKHWMKHGNVINGAYTGNLT